MSASSTMTAPIEQASWEAFARNTSDHELTVLRDDGLYRHLRLAEPGTRMWSIDILTWPGHLATTGDIGSGFMFSRTTDMIDFFAGRNDFRTDFGAPSIDFRYWAGKLCGRTLWDVYEHSSRDFMQQIRDAIYEFVADGGDLAESDRAWLIADAQSSSETAEEAHRFLSDHEYVFGTDTWEWEFTEIDFQFGLACYAIDKVVTDYRAGKTEA